MILTRRRFIAGLGSFLAAPAIVRASSLMPIAALVPEVRWRAVWGQDHIERMISPPIFTGEVHMINGIPFVSRAQIIEGMRRTSISMRGLVDLSA